VRKLEDGGVIRGYHAVVDASQLGYAIRAVMRVGRMDESQMRRALDISPEVLTAFDVTGEDSWILEIAVRDVAHLKDVLQRFCQQTPTSTAIILRALREHAPLKPLPTVEPEPAPTTAAPATKKPRQGRASRA
jgi:Lrp/AsnC family leucine-responsive transcriptional regulator